MDEDRSMCTEHATCPPAHTRPLPHLEWYTFMRQHVLSTLFDTIGIRHASYEQNIHRAQTNSDTSSLTISALVNTLAAVSPAFAFDVLRAHGALSRRGAAKIALGDVYHGWNLFRAILDSVSSWHRTDTSPAATHQRQEMSLMLINQALESCDMRHDPMYTPCVRHLCLELGVATCLYDRLFDACALVQWIHRNDEYYI